MIHPKSFVSGSNGGAKRFAPATMRNRDGIVDILREILPSDGQVLEVASGTGEHAVHFAHCFPALGWQPSDPDPIALASIEAWCAEAGLPNIMTPVQLDATNATWPLTSADAILCINMVHISPWAATVGLFRGAASLLGPGAALFLYGPYIQQSVPTAASNLAFDASLKNRDPAWGLRSVEEVIDLAVSYGFIVDKIIEMAANNLSLVFRVGDKSI